MFRKYALLSLLLAFSLPAHATQSRYTWEMPVGFINTVSITSAPRGFVDFCARHPEECLPAATIPRRMHLDARRMRELNTVNMDVNDSHDFNRDLDRDLWEYPVHGYGDCEDFLLEKRRRLIDLGWPRESLLITIVDRRGEELPEFRTHAFLTVRTAQGDYVLDTGIRPAVAWSKAARLYRYRMIQTEGDPRLWATIDQSAPLD